MWEKKFSAEYTTDDEIEMIKNEEKHGSNDNQDDEISTNDIAGHISDTLYYDSDDSESVGGSSPDNNSIGRNGFIEPVMQSDQERSFEVSEDGEDSLFQLDDYVDDLGFYR